MLMHDDLSLFIHTYPEYIITHKMGSERERDIYIHFFMCRCTQSHTHMSHMHIFSDFSACCQAVWVADGNSYLKAATFGSFRTKISQAVELLSDLFMLSHIFSPTMMLPPCQGTPMASHTEEKQASVSNQT